MTTQFRKTSRHSLDCEHQIIASILVLLLSCSPAAILFTITLLIINAIQGQSQRTCAHIVQEILENQPSTAYCDTASAIVLPIVGLWIETSIKHFCPSGVGGRSGHSMRNIFALGTSLCPSSFQVGVVANGLTATSAAAYTKRLSVTAWGVRDHCELAECLSDERWFGWHNGTSIIASGGRPATTGAHCDYAEEPQCKKG